MTALAALGVAPSQALAATVLVHVVATLPPALLGLAATLVLHVRITDLEAGARSQLPAPAVRLTGTEMDRAQQARLVRLAGFALPIVALGVLFAILAVYFERGFVPGDSFTYLAAGERLNAGHPLYALSPGDRPVELHPPYWTVPLLSPPLVAVLARPFALLSDAGAYLWWACCLASIGLVVVGLLRARPVAGSVALLAPGRPARLRDRGRQRERASPRRGLRGLAPRTAGRLRPGGRAGRLRRRDQGDPLPAGGLGGRRGGRAGFRSVVLGGVLAGAVRPSWVPASRPTSTTSRWCAPRTPPA